MYTGVPITRCTKVLQYVRITGWTDLMAFRGVEILGLPAEQGHSRPSALGTASTDALALCPKHALCIFAILSPTGPP